MNVHGNPKGKRWNALCSHIASSWISVASLVRAVPLFFSARPKTPLRVLCIMAFDAVSALRHSKRLPKTKIRTLAALLDFAACANADFDNKRFCGKEFRTTRQLLEEAGIRPAVEAFLRRLRQLETKRPLPGGSPLQFQNVGSYREAVARLSLGMVAAIALGHKFLDDGIGATYREDDLAILFRIVMQCQVIDDLLDYSKDKSARLPSFLTASHSLEHAFALTHRAALGYADTGEFSRTSETFPLRVALYFVSSFTKLILVLGRWRQRIRFVHLVPDDPLEPTTLPADVVAT